ncbi:MAG TPA: hypothetical protein VGF55_11945 [Gemmataceae bacterium]|jgi:hypothetical protein
MPIRVLLDGTFTATVNYYQTFPTEPIVKPNADLDVKVPIDPADKINPITLLALLTRMLALPATEKHLLIVTHGNEAGLPFPPAPGSEQHAEADNLNTLTVVGKVLKQIPDVLKRPLDQQPAEFAKLLQTAKNLDKSEVFPAASLAALLSPEDDDEPDTPAKKQDRQKKAVALFQAIVEWTLNALAGKNDPLPAGATTGGTAYRLKVNRSQLDELLKKGNEVWGRFDRIDFRGCSIGKSTNVLEVIRAYFGCRQVCAPDVLAFDGTMTVVVDPKFDAKLDANIDAVTRGQAVAGHAPVKRDKATNKVVKYPLAQMPMTRRFDADKARPGDEVFIRMWITDIEPHHMPDWWMRAVSASSVEQFVKDMISPDVSRWTARGSLPVWGLWLVDDFNTPPPAVVTVDPNAGYLDPTRSPPPPPPFALARDPEYRNHLICVP